MVEPYRIVGQGLAGTCLAWRFLERGIPFEIVDRNKGGSSRVAAGMINPLTGKNFLPSWRIGDFLPEAIAFYRELEAKIGVRLWYPHPVIRLVSDPAAWAKMQSRFDDPAISAWMVGEVAPPSGGWIGAVEVMGGGRLDVPKLLAVSRVHFIEQGLYRHEEVEFDPQDQSSIWCEGASGLIVGRPGPHRCAKGEILTIRAEGWEEDRIRIGDGSWLIPVGDGIYKVGATYVWDDYEEVLSPTGRSQVEAMAARLAPGPFEVIGHEVGIRPILRRSQPLIGRYESGWLFNGLGSKGSLYAPGYSERLVRWLVDGIEPEEEINLQVFLKKLRG
jgi:glycine oxidase